MPFVAPFTSADRQTITTAKRLYLQRSLEELFGTCVAVCIATPDMYGSVLFPPEAEYQASMVESRRQEFAAGRASARGALGRLGAAPASIARGRDGAPTWPSGFVGSITHCPGFCAAVAARASDISGLGLDAETADTLPAELLRWICRSEEQAAFAQLPWAPACGWGKLAFSAKEALFKGWRPPGGGMLDFLEVRLHFTPLDSDGAKGLFQAREASGCDLAQDRFRTIRGFWMTDNERIYSGAVRTHDG